MAQFIALLKRDYERFSEAQFAPLLEPEAEQARKLYAEGSLRAIWGRKDHPGALLLFEAPDEGAARAMAASLPLLARGMLIVEAFLEVGPYRGFGPQSGG
jgi:muconolactone delta-isomerase